MEIERMIKNTNYKRFLESGEIIFIDKIHIAGALENIKKNVPMARALLITLYLTGARPNEVLKMRGEDIFREKNYIVFKLKGSKGGLPRLIRVPIKQNWALEAYNYAKSVFPDMLLYFKFRNKYKRIRENKSGTKEIIDISDKLRYYFKIWFKGVIPDTIPPYYLRHSRFSKLSAKGATQEQLRHLKGSRTFASIHPYTHFSKDMSVKTARMID